MDSGLKLWGILGTSAIVISNDSPTLVKFAARLAKVVFHGRIQICDGVADDVEIQAAIDALPATGGEVKLLDGTYTLAAALVMDSYQTLRGCGSNTILTVSDGFDMITATGGAGTEKVNILIADLTMDGTAGGSASWDGIVFTYVDNSRIVNIWTRNHVNGIEFTTSDKNKIEGCEIADCQTGVYINNSENCTVVDCIVRGHSTMGIDILVGHRTILSNNSLPDNTGEGIVCDDSYGCVIDGNTVMGGTYGIHFDHPSFDCVVSSNVCIDNGDDGICIEAGGLNNVIAGNRVHNSGAWGIEIYADYTLISDNSIDESAYDGIEIGSSHNIIEDNIIVSSSQDTDDSYANIDVYEGNDNFITGNTCRAGALGNKPANHIYLFAGAVRTRIINNDLYNDGLGGDPVADASVTTKYAVYVVPFSDGTDPQDSGYLIDLDTEMARAWLRLPPEVQQVMKMKVYARSVVAEVHEMELQMVVKGGADNEGYGTHDGSIAQLDSASVNFAADDIIHWVNEEAGVLALIGGDSVEVKVLHEAAQVDNCATNAYFRTVEIEYV